MARLACSHCDQPAVYSGMCHMHNKRKERGLPMWPGKGELHLVPEIAAKRTADARKAAHEKWRRWRERRKA